MSAAKTLRERWRAAWRAVGLRRHGARLEIPLETPFETFRETLFETLLRVYAEEHRAYHDARHLEACFAALDVALDAAPTLARRPEEVTLALFFHDAVHDPRADDNEARSAAWAHVALLEAGASRDVAERVQDLVRVTRHDGVPPQGSDAALVADADLSVLGASEPAFADYEARIRREYAWVEEGAYRRGRAEVLRRFLARPRLYATTWFRERLEARARRNLEAAVRRLSA